MTASLKYIISFPIKATCTLISNNNTVRWETFKLIKYSLRASCLIGWIEKRELGARACAQDRNG